MNIEMDPFDAINFFEKTVDNEEEFKRLIEQSVMTLDPTALAFIVSSYLDQYMEREGIKELTKFKGNSVLRRVYEDKSTQ